MLVEYFEFARFAEDGTYKCDFLSLEPVWKWVGDPKDDTHVLLFEVGDTAFVVYPQTIGSVSIHKVARDWWRNLDFFKRSSAYLSNDKRIKAHEGITKEFGLHIEEVDKWLDWVHPKTINVIGYSQGAGHATLAFRHFLHNRRTVVINGYPFEGLRVYNPYGARDFKKALKKRPECSFTRVVNFKDIVTRVAPWFFGFRHVSKSTQIGKKGYWIFSKVDPHYPAVVKEALIKYEQEFKK